jgi:hypothetical protein
MLMVVIAEDDLMIADSAEDILAENERYCAHRYAKPLQSSNVRPRDGCRMAFR